MAMRFIKRTFDYSLAVWVFLEILNHPMGQWVPEYVNGKLVQIAS